LTLGTNVTIFEDGPAEEEEDNREESHKSDIPAEILTLLVVDSASMVSLPVPLRLGATI
jgi:hypothetical protein